MTEKETVKIDYKQEVVYKNAELRVSNAKVGEYVSKLMDAETKNLLLTEENIKLKNKLEEFDMLKEDLDEKNKIVHSNGTNVQALRDKIKNMKKQHSEELEHHGKIIDELQRKNGSLQREVDSLYAELGKEVNELKKEQATQQNKLKVIDVKHDNNKKK
tara:strand:+ start:7664 stop:8140 length:477 start_codon:yes stop_codon:yes gene_type:complete